MTDKTGICMLSDKFQIFHKYVEDIMGRPVYTHEMGIKAIDDEIKEKAKADFIALCAEQEPCEDAISRRDMALNIVSFYNKATGKKKTLDFLCKCVEGLPSVQPKQRTGRWIPTGYDGYADGNPVYDWWECSECGWEHTGDEDTLTPYCPNCGAKMEEGD